MNIWKLTDDELLHALMDDASEDELCATLGLSVEEVREAVMSGGITIGDNHD